MIFRREGLVEQAVQRRQQILVEQFGEKRRGRPVAGVADGADAAPPAG